MFQRTNAVRKDGFTLIELLVVIAIIAILAAILFPVFAQARAKARAIACLSHLKQLGTATMMYMQDYDETYPSGWGEGAPAGGTIWRISLQPYIQKYGGHANTAGGASYDSSTMGQSGVFSCPDRSAGRSYGPVSYGYNNSQLAMYNGNWNSPLVNGVHAYPGYPQAHIKRPSDMAMYADAGETGNAGAAANRGLDPNYDQGGGNNCVGYETNNGQNATGDCGPYDYKPEVWQERWSPDWSFAVPGTTERWRANSDGGRRPISRHSQGFNICYADGHAKWSRGSVLKAKVGSSQDVFHNHD